jgi:20S proteasome alpha/beta subunit
MTCIAAIKHNNIIYMGADTVASDDYGMYSRSMPKIFYNGPFLIGAAGSAKIGQLLQYSLDVPAQKHTEDDMTYMVNSFCEAVRQVFIMRGAMFRENEVEQFHGELLVSYNDQLYVIDGVLCITQLSYPYASVGSGAAVACGSLHVLMPSVQAGALSPKDAIQLALKAAEEHAIGVRGPFDIISTSEESEA